MIHRRLAVVPIALVTCVLLPLQIRSQAPPAAPASPRPALVVMLVVDQMRADYVVNYGHQWRGGLRRLVDSGAWFQRAVYPYAYTMTSAGHATISTGTLPRTHGITGNSWWDAASAKTVGCTEDGSERIVSYGRPVQGGQSIARIAVPTFTDHLRAQAAVRPRVVTLSMKEQTAIILAGHHADAATWFDTTAGSMVTSSAFASAPVPFVERFVKSHPIEADLNATWTPRNGASSYAYTDAATWERPPAFWTSAFPHPLRSQAMKSGQEYEAWAATPFSDAYLERLGEAAIEALQLGKGPGTDYLAISFSTLDLVGHDFGPQSHEVQDVLLRLDDALASLFAALDRTVGRSRYVVAMAGDHGVSPIPEQVAAQGVSAGRIATAAIGQQVEEVLRPSLRGAKAVARTMGGQIYLTADGRRAIEEDQRMRDNLLGALERIPGVARVLLTAERARWSAADSIAHDVANSCYPQRVGDIVLVPQPYWLFGSGSATTHGTPYLYDAWVPLFLYGNGIRAGRYGQPVSPADIAPTLAWLCGITMPEPDGGRPLLEAVAYTPR